MLSPLTVTDAAHMVPVLGADSLYGGRGLAAPDPVDDTPVGGHAGTQGPSRPTGGVALRSYGSAFSGNADP